MLLCVVPGEPRGRLRRRGVPAVSRGSSVRAYLMAAGLGTRLYPLTGLTSKPMVPILNRPVMEHMLNLLRRHRASSRGPGGGGCGGGTLSLLGWHADVASPAFGYTCAALLAASLLLKVSYIVFHSSFTAVYELALQPNA